MRTILSLAAALISLFATGCAHSPPARPMGAGGNVLVQGANVFDGERVIGTRDVLIRNGMIRRIAAQIASETGVRVIDGSGRTMMPGMIDAHVHAIPGGAADALRFGVTSQLDLYSFGNSSEAAQRKARRESVNRTDEADVWSSGFGITPPGGHPTQMLVGEEGVPPIPTLAETEDADAFVAARVRDGADYIKIIQDDGTRHGRVGKLAHFERERFTQVLRAAKASGLKVVVHAQQLAEATAAVDGRADVLAHALADYPPDASLLQKMRRNRTAIIGTLAVYDGIGGGTGVKGLMSDPLIAPYLSPTQKMLMSIPLPAQPVERTNALETVRRAHRAGVVILAGTDAPNPTTGFGVSMQLELELLVAAGLTPVEALRAATSNPARIFGLKDRGSIQSGMRGDVVLVDGDPTTDIRAARRIVAVLKNGWLVNRAPPQ